MPANRSDILKTLADAFIMLVVTLIIMHLVALNTFSANEAMQYHATDNFGSQLLLVAKEYLEDIIALAKAIFI